jgi:hypothetical protein
MRRKLTERERMELNQEWPELMLRRRQLKIELKDSGKAMRYEIKKIEERMDHISAILRRGEIDESDQLRLEEAS